MVEGRTAMFYVLQEPKPARLSNRLGRLNYNHQPVCSTGFVIKNPGLGPDQDRLLLKVNYQLIRHGANFNQIDKSLDAGDIMPD